MSCLAAAAPARAQRPQAPSAIVAAGFAALPPGAPAYAVLALHAPEALLGWLRGFQGDAQMYVAMAIGQLGPELQSVLGFDPTGPGGWAASGLAVDAPIAISLGAIDAAAADKAYRLMASGKATKAPRVFAHTRAVARVADEAKVKAWLARLATPPIPQVKVRKALEKLGVVAVIVHDENALVARLGNGVLTIDWVTEWGGRSVDWKQDAGAITKLLAPPKKGGAQGVLARKAGVELAGADAGLWIDPERLLDQNQALGKANVVHAIAAAPAADRERLRAEGDQEIARCDELRGVAQVGPFEDVALLFRAEPAAFEWSAVWGVRPAAALGAKLVTTDDGLVDLAAAGDAVAVGALYANLAGVARTLPRPGPFGKDLHEVARAAHECGYGGAIVAGLFGWPQLLALAAEEAGRADPVAKAVVENVRNLAFAVKTVAQADKDSVALLLASFEPSAAAALDPAEKTTPRTVKGRRIETWSTSPMSVRLKTTLDGGKLAYGTTLGGTRAIDWFWGRPSPRPVAGAPPLVAVVRADLPRILRQLFGADPYAARTFDEIGKRLGLVTGALELDGATLGASLRMEIH